MTHHYKIKSAIWLYPGMAAWHFVSIPQKESREIKARCVGIKRGFGSVRVEVTLGQMQWKTSIFPDKKSGSYFLPLKSEVRKKEKIAAGDTIKFEMDILNLL